MNYAMFEPRIPFIENRKHPSHREVFWGMGGNCVVSGKEMHTGRIPDDQESRAHSLSRPRRQGRDGDRHTNRQHYRNQLGTSRSHFFRK